MRYGRMAATIVVVLVLGLIGTLTGPGWHPQPLDETIVPETADTTIGSNAPTAPVGTYAVTRTVVDVPVSDGVVVQATVAEPVGAQGPRPGVVFMHGAGTATRENFTDTTTALASAGVVTLVPDKRADTYTTRSRDYAAMAADYLRSVEVLRRWPGVDPAAVGVYGESEGAMPAPIAATADPAVAFVILVSAPILPIREQGALAADSYLREVGAPDRVLRAIPRLVGGTPPGGGFGYFDFDVSPYHQRLTQPVLVAYGTGDASMPIVQGPVRLLRDLAVAGNDAYTIRYYAGANHGIRVDGQLAPGFTEDLARWIQGLPATATAAPRIAGDDPVQIFRADPVDRPRWYASGDMILVGLAVGAGLLAGSVVLSVAAQAPRLRGRAAWAPPPPLSRYTAALGLATVATWVLFGSYLAGVADLALNYRTNDLLVQGGWVLVQSVGVLAAGVLVLTVAAVWRQAHGSTRTGAMAWAILGTAIAGAVVLLVNAAYWGVYPAVP